MAIVSLIIWIGTYIVWEQKKIVEWFDNKFGQEDPMPPMPKQQNNPLNIGEGSTINYDKPSKSDQPKE